MNTTNSDTYEENGIIYRYSPANKRWVFESPAHRYSLIHPCRGGWQIAQKVARQVAASLNRAKGQLDQLGKFHIKRLTGY
jgi:hypothetical protein